jgi:hypothetical protein
LRAVRASVPWDVRRWVPMAKPTSVCTQCHDSVRPQQASALVAVLGFILFALLGLAFWPLWLLALLCLLWPRPKLCPKCKGKNCMVPLDSKRGRDLLEQVNPYKGPGH